jgi:hypothetical protein
MVDEGWAGFARSGPDTGLVVTESEAGIHCSGVFGVSSLYLGRTGTGVIPRRRCRVGNSRRCKSMWNRVRVWRVERRWWNQKDKYSFDKSEWCCWLLLLMRR